MEKAFLSATAMSCGLRSSMEDRTCRADDMKLVLEKLQTLETEYNEQMAVKKKSLSKSETETIDPRRARQNSISSLHVEQSFFSADFDWENESGPSCDEPAIDLSHLDMGMIAVFDGFGGSYVSSWLSKNFPFGLAKYIKKGHPTEKALEYTFKHSELLISKMRESKRMGSTGLVVVGSANKSLGKDSYRFTIANLGECSAMAIGIDGSLTEVSVEPHTPFNEKERERVERAGGTSRIKTKVVGSCISNKEVVDENYTPTFEPGQMHVGHAFGGMKAKMSFDPPFIVADPEIIKISATYNGKKTVGILIVSDGVNASKGARLSAKVIEKLVQSKVQKLNAKLQECGVKRNNMILETANDLATEIVNAATSAQEKLGSGDNISAAVMMCSSGF